MIEARGDIVSNEQVWLLVCTYYGNHLYGKMSPLNTHTTAIVPKVLVQSGSASPGPKYFNGQCATGQSAALDALLDALHRTLSDQ